MLGEERGGGIMTGGSLRVLGISSAYHTVWVVWFGKLMQGYRGASSRGWDNSDSQGIYPTSLGFGLQNENPAWQPVRRRWLFLAAGEGVHIPLVSVHDSS